VGIVGLIGTTVDFVVSEQIKVRVILFGSLRENKTKCSSTDNEKTVFILADIILFYVCGIRLLYF
jgi:hypothetical protein